MNISMGPKIEPWGTPAKSRKKKRIDHLKILSDSGLGERSG